MIRGLASRLLGEKVDAPTPATEREHALAAVTDIVARAPWRLDPLAYAPPSALGFDHVAVFDAIATASTAVAMPRIAVALTRITS